MEATSGLVFKHKTAIELRMAVVQDQVPGLDRVRYTQIMLPTFWTLQIGTEADYEVRSRMYYKFWISSKKPRPKLIRRPVIAEAKKLHEEMYTVFAK